MPAHGKSSKRSQSQAQPSQACGNSDLGVSIAPQALNRKRTRHGDCFAPGVIGPKSLAEVFAWPRQALSILKQDDEQFATFSHALLQRYYDGYVLLGHVDARGQHGVGGAGSQE